MKIKLFSIFLLAVLASFISCTDSDGSNMDTGKLVIQLTDAPFPHDLVAEANVTIFKIDARYKGEDMENEMENEMEGETEEEMENEDGSSFVVLMEEEIQVNLLDLTNGITETLVNTEVPVGTYDLIRVYVRGINVVLVDETSFDLKVPSGEQTGIKVFVKPGLTVAGGLTSDLLLDFDVSKSFVAQGNLSSAAGIKGFHFKPVIKASNMSTAGSLSGMVTTIVEDMAVGMEGVQIAVFAADTLNTTTFTDMDGAYMVLGLMAGSYDVAAELEGYERLTVEDIQIVPANKTIQNFELVPAP